MRRPELNPALDASPRPDHAAPAHPRLIGGSRLTQDAMDTLDEWLFDVSPGAPVSAVII